ncbi:MAG: 3-hydroxy-3-methylglutaryl CoA synthase [Gammaproteobacteria bacterium]|nr:3-hydroxy-3-methylglutaryl CoA synthase [Gammaproteobacteria bacterium]
MVGISALAVYLPRLRLARKAIVDAHRWADPGLAGKAQGERTMCNWDEDAVTMGVEAARVCLGDSRDVDCLLFASTSAPFADRQHAGIVAGALNLPEDIATLDAGASQRAGTSALIQGIAAVKGGLHASALLVTGDKRRTKAASPGELDFGDGAVAVRLSNNLLNTACEQNIALEFLACHTVTVDFIDHFRGAGEEFDYGWEERWIRDEGLARIVPDAVGKALAKAGVKPADVAHFILPSTIRGAVASIGKAAGVPPGAVADTLAAQVGETGVAHPLVMLAARLSQDGIAAGQIIVLCGFGQGCDAIVLRIGDVEAARRIGACFQAALATRMAETNYSKYLAFNNLVVLEKGMRADKDDFKTALTVTWRKRDMLTGLVGGRCTICGTLQFPRTDICVNPQCRAVHSQEPHSFREEKANIVTWSADFLTYTAEPPAHYGMISFKNGGRFMTDFTDVTVGQIDVGTAVRMVFRIKSVDRIRGFVRYFWKAAPERSLT